MSSNPRSKRVPCGFAICLTAFTSLLVLVPSAHAASTTSLACVSYGHVPAGAAYQVCDPSNAYPRTGSGETSATAAYGLGTAFVNSRYLHSAISVTAVDWDDDPFYGLMSWGWATYTDVLLPGGNGPSGNPVELPHIFHITGSVPFIEGGGFVRMEFTTFVDPDYTGPNPPVSTSHSYTYFSAQGIDFWITDTYEGVFGTPYQLSVGFSVAAWIGDGPMGAASGSFVDSAVLHAIVVPEGTTISAESGTTYPLQNASTPGIPEPSTLALLGLGLAGLAATRRRKQ